MTDKETEPTKEMWDSEKDEWVPFDIWGAHFIVNDRKEHLCLRTYVELSPLVKYWQSIDSSYLNDKLKENKADEEKNSPFISFAGYQNFYEMVRQDIQKYKDEGRITEYPNEYIKKFA